MLSLPCRRQATSLALSLQLISRPAFGPEFSAWRQLSSAAWSSCQVEHDQRASDSAGTAITASKPCVTSACCFTLPHLLVTHAGGLRRQYEEAVAAGDLLADEEQAACINRLSTLADQLVGYTASLTAYRRELHDYQVGSHFLNCEHQGSTLGRNRSFTRW